MREPLWLIEARRHVGQCEVPGPPANPLIVRWWEAIRAPFREDSTPWCAAFVGGVLERCGIRSTRSAAARSYVDWGEPLAAPAVGAVVVFSRPGSGWSGHVAFVVGKDERGRLLCLGGNQGDAVSIAPFELGRVIGYRWPSGEPMPTAGPLPVLLAAGETSTNEA
jgi:uncharacterized protein (TIGR02594 family)